MMMKRLAPYLWAIAVCIPVCFGSIADDPEIADGYLTDGEYVSMGVLEYNEELFISGGGAERIEVRDNSYIEVQNTAKPLGYHSGIYDIMLGDNSELFYLGGVTDEISLGGDATAKLKGGTINGITIGRAPSDSCYVTIYCQTGYLMNQSGISGLWGDGNTFDIQFVNVGSPYPPTADFVNIEIVPEPATMILLGLGALVIRKRKQ